MLELLPLAIPVLGLLIYFIIRLRYRFTCPECGRWAKKGADVTMGYQINRSGKKRDITVPCGTCPSCDHFWTLKRVHVRTSGLIVPKGTRMKPGC